MRKIILRGIQVVLVIALIISGYKIYKYRENNQEFDMKNEEIQRTMEKWEDEYPQSLERKNSAEGEVNDQEAINEKERLKIKYLKQQYPDIIGWIRIPGTSIDLPIVQGRDNVFYLNHDYKGNYDPFGTVFMEIANQPDFSDQNTILYGHNVRSGKVFHDLHQYKDQDFLSKAPIIEISYLNGLYRYKIFAAYRADLQDQFRKTSYKEKDIKDYLLLLEKKNLINEETPEKWDKILTLQTCSGDENRWVVHGVKIDE
ncbi:MAG: class B sortase [Tissierellia bacterium]|nr:class B sortase [Tissierellia bacterium]